MLRGATIIIALLPFIALSQDLRIQAKHIEDSLNRVYQQTVDSAAGNVKGRISKRGREATRRAEKRIEGLNSIQSNRSDSLTDLASTHRITDSLKIISWGDSMRSSIKRKFSENFVRGKMDSIRGLKLPPIEKQRKLDSMENKTEDLRMELGSKQQQLQEKVTSRYDRWQGELNRKLNSDSSGLRLPNSTGLASSVGSIPKIDLPAGDNGMPNIPNPRLDGEQTGSIINDPTSGVQNTSNTPEMPDLNSGDFKELGMSKDLAGIDPNLSLPSTDQLLNMDERIAEYTGPIAKYKERLAEYKASLKDPSTAVEGGITGISEVQGVSKELGAAKSAQQNNEFVQTADKMKDPNAMKEELQNQAVDHFAGKQKELQGAMSQMAKYKKKYPSLGSLSEIKKNDWLPHNGLKGVPFRERIRFGINMGFQNNHDTLLVDLYPNASYRITGRIETGAGFMYRLKGVKKDVSLDQYRPVWGTSMFGVVKTFKSVFFRIELDGASYPANTKVDEPKHRDWRWAFLSGIQTQFKMGKQFTGNIQMLYNFDKSLKDVFPDRLAVRIGVQYRLKASLPKKSDIHAE